MEYTTSVSSRMYIDPKGNRLESMDVDVDGHRESYVLSETVSDYNSGKEIAERWERAHEGLQPFSNPEIREDDWRSQLWWMLYAGMVANLRKWRTRHT